MKTYSTSQIARIVGVHPNTVRMYEEWELIQKPERKANGYRVFTDIHIDQFHLARGMDMVIFAIIMPIIVLIILGVIFGNRTATPDVEYTFIEQSFGALACISICAGGVMGLPLAVSDYRGKGILKRYQVTPVSPVMILVVAVMMYVVYSFVSLVSLYVISVMFFHFTMRVFIFKQYKIMCYNI